MLCFLSIVVSVGKMCCSAETDRCCAESGIRWHQQLDVAWLHCRTVGGVGVCYPDITIPDKKQTYYRNSSSTKLSRSRYPTLVCWFHLALRFCMNLAGWELLAGRLEWSNMGLWCSSTDVLLRITVCIWCLCVTPGGCVSERPREVLSLRPPRMCGCCCVVVDWKIYQLCQSHTALPQQ